MKPEAEKIEAQRKGKLEAEKIEARKQRQRWPGAEGRAVGREDGPTVLAGWQPGGIATVQQRHGPRLAMRTAGGCAKAGGLGQRSLHCAGRPPASTA